MGNGTTQKQSVRWHKRLGAYLLAAGLVDDDTLSKALEIQRTQSPPKTRIGKLLIDMGMTDDVNIAKTLASQLNIDFLHLTNLKIPNDVLNVIPASIAYTRARSAVASAARVSFKVGPTPRISCEARFNDDGPQSGPTYKWTAHRLLHPFVLRPILPGTAVSYYSNGPVRAPQLPDFFLSWPRLPDSPICAAQ